MRNFIGINFFTLFMGLMALLSFFDMARSPDSGERVGHALAFAGFVCLVVSGSVFIKTPFIVGGFVLAAVGLVVQWKAMARLRAARGKEAEHK